MKFEDSIKMIVLCTTRNAKSRRESFLSLSFVLPLPTRRRCRCRCATDAAIMRRDDEYVYLLRPLSGNRVLLSQVIEPHAAGDNHRKRAEEAHGTLQRHRPSVVRLNLKVALDILSVPVLDERPVRIHGQHLHGVCRRRRVHRNHNFFAATQRGGVKRIHQILCRICGLFAPFVVRDVIFILSPRAVHGLVRRVAQLDADFRRGGGETRPVHGNLAVAGFVCLWFFKGEEDDDDDDV